MSCFHPISNLFLEAFPLLLLIDKDALRLPSVEFDPLQTFLKRP